MMKSAKEISQKVLASDKFAVFSIFADEAQDELPIFGKISKLAKIYEGAIDRVAKNKLEKALTELEAISPVLVRATVENLQNEYGFEYSDDVFLDAILSSNSGEMARIPGKVFVAYCNNEISIDAYWSLLNITKILIFPDIKRALSSESRHVSELKKDVQNRLQAAGLCFNTSGFGSLGTEWNEELLDALILCLEGRTSVQHAKYDAKKFPRDVSELPPAE